MIKHAFSILLVKSDTNQKVLKVQFYYYRVLIHFPDIKKTKFNTCHILLTDRLSFDFDLQSIESNQQYFTNQFQHLNTSSKYSRVTYNFF